MKLTVFCYGTTEIDEHMAFQNGDKQKKIPISLLFFLIQTDKKNILVDVGCDTMPGFPLYTFCSPVEVLEKTGISRDEICGSLERVLLAMKITLAEDKVQKLRR